MQDNLKKKYGITDEELKSAVDQIPFGKIACDGIVLVALVDLISNGDIAPCAHMEGFVKYNLKEKYGITNAQLNVAVDQIPFGKIACDGIVLLALIDLIVNGDIRLSEEQEQ